MRVYHVVVEYDSGIHKIIEDIQYIRERVEICGVTDDLLKFLLQQLVEENV